MTLNYDFDIFEMDPSTGHNDPELQDFLAKAGLSRRDQDSAIALFRHKQTADALCRAPDTLREYFLQSGFGLNTFDSGAPAGQYPEQDEEARLRIIDQLTQNAGRFVLPAEALRAEDFCLEHFIAHLSAARPVQNLDAHAPHDAIGPATQKSALQLGTLGIASLTKRMLRGMPLWKHSRREARVN